MAAVDYERAWTELAAYVAGRPSHGRQDLLVQMAQVAERHQVPEDEMERALRLALPPLADLLFNRLASASTPDPETTAQSVADASAHVDVDHHSMAPA